MQQTRLKPLARMPQEEAGLGLGVKFYPEKSTLSLDFSLFPINSN
jgi:hypothetical protein